MSLTVGAAVERAFLRVGKGSSESQAKVYRDAIESFIPNAINKLADMASQRPDYPLQQKTFASITIAGGIGVLPTSMAIHTIATQGRVTATGQAFSLQYLPNLPDLDLPHVDEFIYYAIRGNAVGGSIFISAGTRAGTAPTSVDILAGVYPSLITNYTITTAFTDLAVQHEDDLIDILVQFVMEGKVDNAPPPSQ